MNWHNIDTSRIRCYRNQHIKNELILSIIERYETLIQPRLNAENNGTFCQEKMHRFSKLLKQTLLKEDDIYLSIDLMVKCYCEQYQLTEFEASFAIDYMLMMYFDQLTTEHMLTEETIIQLILTVQNCDIALLNVIVRNASGYSVTPAYDHVIAWLKSDECQSKNIFTFNEGDKSIVLKFDQQQDHLRLIHDAALHQQYVEKSLMQAKARYAIGLYGEDRTCYQTPMFFSPGCAEKRSVHLGLDIFTKAQEPIHAPIEARVFSIKYNAEKLDYGHTLILSHKIDGHDLTFYTLYGHLSQHTLKLVSVGDRVDAGQMIGYIGDRNENGGWSPHLHFQIIIDLLSCKGDFYGACEPSMWHLWQKICPDPLLLMNTKVKSFIKALD